MFILLPLSIENNVWDKVFFSFMSQVLTEKMWGYCNDENVFVINSAVGGGGEHVKHLLGKAFPLVSYLLSHA